MKVTVALYISSLAGCVAFGLLSSLAATRRLIRTKRVLLLDNKPRPLLTRRRFVFMVLPLIFYSVGRHAVEKSIFFLLRTNRVLKSNDVHQTAMKSLQLRKAKSRPKSNSCRQPEKDLFPLNFRQI